MSNKFKIIIGSLLLLFASTLVLSACGNSESHTHQYGEWSVTRTATCTEAGEEARFCSCGDTQTRTIPTKEHYYGDWTVTKIATCTEAGEQEKVCSCGDKLTQSLAAGHSYGEWVVVKEATCAQEGERYIICSACNDKKTESLSKSSTHTYNEGTITKSPTCTASGSKTVVCTVCNATKEESIPSLGHSVDNTGKCSRCGLVTLNMTNSEIEKSKKIETMSHSVSEYSDDIIINITLKDGDSYSVQVPVYVDVKIVDDNGNILYSKTIIKKSSQSKVTIDYDEITDAFTNTGTLYYTVYNDYVSFDAISKELEKIPWTVTIELPNVPQTISDTGYFASSCKVTGITYEVSGDNVTFYFTGEKTYDKNGNSYSQSCKIGWKLYDEDGYVVDDGTCYTTSIKVGEKFKDASATAYNIIEQGKTYRLVIMNVS